MALTSGERRWGTRPRLHSRTRPQRGGTQSPERRPSRSARCRLVPEPRARNQATAFAHPARRIPGPLARQFLVPTPLEPPSAPTPRTGDRRRTPRRLVPEEESLQQAAGHFDSFVGQRASPAACLSPPERTPLTPLHRTGADRPGDRSLRGEGYRRHRESPQPPPPSTATTSSTITTVVRSMLSTSLPERLAPASPHVEFHSWAGDCDPGTAEGQATHTRGIGAVPRSQRLGHIRALARTPATGLPEPPVPPAPSPALLDRPGGLAARTVHRHAWRSAGVTSTGFLATAFRTRHLIIATFTASFTPRHATMA